MSRRTWIKMTRYVLFAFNQYSISGINWCIMKRLSLQTIWNATKIVHSRSDSHASQRVRRQDPMSFFCACVSETEAISDITFDTDRVMLYSPGANTVVPKWPHFAIALSIYRTSVKDTQYKTKP